MSHIAYYRCSTASQSTASRRAALTHANLIEKGFFDEGVSGAVMAAKRPGFSEMLSYIRSGDTLHVYAVDRLGRDAIDVLTNVRALLAKGVTLEVNGLGQISKGVGELLVTMLAQIAEMERERIIKRTSNGRKLAKDTFEATGKTHRGKDSLGRKRVLTEEAVLTFRGEGKERKSIAETARAFEVSEATIKRYLNPKTRAKAA